MSKIYGSVLRSVLSLFMVGIIVFVASPFTGNSVQSTALAASAGRTTPYLQNGSFENGLTNWTSSAARVNLGVTTLGGCLTVDTVAYADIWTRSDAYGTVPAWASSKGPKPTNDNDTGAFSSFSVTNAISAPKSATFGGGTLGPAQGTSIVKLTLGSGSGTDGYHVVHGPAIVSDTFRGILNQVITLNWYGTTGQDDFAVFGYLLDTDANNDGTASGAVDDCVQYVLLDTTGSEVGNWQYADVTVPATKDFYKFVFVGGTFDKTGLKGSGASFYVDNISQGTPQTVTFSLSGVTANYASGNTTAPFQLPGTASSGMAVTYTSSTPAKCTVTSAGMLTVVAAGTCAITATQSGGETGGTLYASSPSVTQSFEITAISATAQTIAFSAPTDRMATDADFDLAATATSGLTVTFTSSTTSVCTVSGVTVNLVAAGTCTIVAAQAGGVNSGTNYAVAPTVSRSFLSKGSQTITFNALSDKDPTAANFAVSATSSAGLTVTYSTTSTGVCSVTSGGTVSILGAGTCTISANQAGGATGGITYAAATAVTQSFTVRTGQTITFAAPVPVDEDAAPFSLTATADSGLAVTFTSSTPLVCTVTSAGEVTMVSYGTCTITAAQVGGTNSGTDYSAAPSVTRSFTSRRLQTITFGALSDKDPTAANFNLNATASSTLVVAYTTKVASICTVTSGGTVTIVGPGTCTIVAEQTGGTVGGIVYATAPTVSQSFTVRTAQSITFAEPSTVNQDAAAFSLSATASSTLAVTYTSSTPSVCTVTSAGLVTMVNYGTCTITAAQAGGVSGSTSYAAATNVTQSFTSRRLQTITFTVLSDKSILDPSFTVGGSTTSGLALSFSTTTSTVCTVTSGGAVTMLTTGLCSITAAQAGGLTGGITYAAATPVTQSFMIQTIQTITFAQPTDRLSTAASFSIGATASSGLPVTYVSSTPSVCTVTTSGTVTLVTYGTCTIVASQAGGTKDGTVYVAANNVTRSFNSLRAQTVSFTVPTEKIYNAADFTLTGSSSSTLAVSYASTTPSICTVTPTGTVDLVSPGTCTIEGSQAGGTAGGIVYAASPVVAKSFTVNPVPQSISVAGIPESHEYQGGVDMAGTTSSGFEVTYTSMTPTICTVVGKRVTFIGTGKCTIKGSQAGGTRGGVIYGPGPDITRDFFITSYTPTATVTPTNTRTFTPTLTPTPIPFLLKKGAVGASFVLGLLQNDTLVTWGMNREYQANIPPCCGSGIQDIAVGTNFALALKGGKVFGWGANTRGQLQFPAPTSKDITAVAAGGAHGLALTKKGAVIAWGDNGFKQAQVPKGLKPVKSMAGGSSHTVVLMKDGTVSAWGSNASNQSKPLAGLKFITQVAAGLDHSLALKSDGTVVGWGNNVFGQASIPPNAADIKQISAGTQFSMAVKNDGSVLAWGRNDFNQIVIPTEYTNIYSAFAGYSNTILGLRTGRVVVLGSQTDGVDVSRTPTKTATPTP